MLQSNINSQAHEYPTMRRHPRHNVKWQCRLELGATGLITGVIRDHSEGGICFEPELGWDLGVVYRGCEAVFLLAENESSLAVYCGKGSPKRCRVRWRGFSKRHQCPAIGMEFVS